MKHLAAVLLATAMGGLAPGWTAASTATLEPCQAAATQRPDALRVWARLLEGLGLDAAPAEKGGWLVARLIVTPAWDEGEWAVSVYLPDTGSALVESVEAAEGIGSKNRRLVKVSDDPVPTYEPGIVPVAPAVPVVTKTRAIHRRVAETLARAIASAVRGASYVAEDVIILDATGYHFITRQPHMGPVCAYAASPDEGSLPARLVGVFDLLRRYVVDEVGMEAVEVAVGELPGSPNEGATSERTPGGEMSP